MKTITGFLNHPRFLQALLIIALFIFAAGVVLPIINVTKMMIVENSFSIITGLWQLFEEGQYFIFAIILMFSVLLPLLKIAYLFLLLLKSHAGVHLDSRRSLRLIHRYSRWSMLDVFVVAIFVVTLKLGILASVTIEPGLYFFTSAVLLIMFVTSRVIHLVLPSTHT